MSFLSDLIKKYKDDVDPKILVTYKSPDEYVILNRGDEDLHEIWIELPKPGQEWDVHTISNNFAKYKMPEYHEMVNWGLPAKDQKFKKEVWPDRLAKLVKDFGNDPYKIWPILKQNNGVDYYEEVKWIKKFIKKGFTGDWQFIKGKPTYIDGWHFTYLNTWLFGDMTSPDYRDKDRRWYHAVKYAYTTTEVPVFDEHKRMLYEDTLYGKKPVVKKTSRRTMIGYLYPKGRRDGATNKHLHAQYVETIKRKGIESGLIADTGDKSQEIYEKILLPGYRRMPFFYKPMTSGYDDPKSGLKFAPRKTKSAKEDTTFDPTLSLYSTISYSDKASGSFYDGLKLLWLLADEGGKTTAEDVSQRHKVLLNCAAQGNRSSIGGFIGMPSTVGEMEKKGGMNYYKLAKLSHWQDRDVLGQTPSGLMNFFFPSYDGLEGYVDEYGDTVIDTPKEPVKGIDGKMITVGSRDALKSQREALLKKGDLEAYNEEVRLFPIRFRECFRTKDGEIGFNIKILEDRIDELKFAQNKVCVRGDFKWRNNVFGGVVDFIPNEDGRWYVSKLISHNNKRMRDGDVWIPDPRYANEFTHSGDPFKANKTSGNWGSKGGGSIFWNHDERIDHKDIPIKEWVSHTTVATYLYRPPTLNEYCEDQLMACIYYNAKSFPEIDVPAIWHYYEEKGFGGYLKYDLDPITKKLKNTPGFTSKGSQQKLYNTIRDYIEMHGHREKHIDLLMQFKEASSLEDFTFLDLLVAGGGAIMGSIIVYLNDEEKRREDTNKQTGKQLFMERKYS